jgi:hypothetical protein
MVSLPLRQRQTARRPSWAAARRARRARAAKRQGRSHGHVKPAWARLLVHLPGSKCSSRQLKRSLSTAMLPAAGASGHGQRIRCIGRGFATTAAGRAARAPSRCRCGCRRRGIHRSAVLPPTAGATSYHIVMCIGPLMDRSQSLSNFPSMLALSCCRQQKQEKEEEKQQGRCRLGSIGGRWQQRTSCVGTGASS